MGTVADLNKAVARVDDKPEEARLWALSKKLSKVKGDLLSLGRALMFSQDLSLAAGAHELVGEGEEALQTGQQKGRAALRRLRAASDISETGSVDLLGQQEIPAIGGALVGRDNQSTAPPASRQPPMITKSGNKLADLIRCLNSAQANDSRWSMFAGKYVEYPQFRKEWFAYRGTYHEHVRGELVGLMLTEKCLASSVTNMI
jgi:hypothetical protein